MPDFEKQEPKSDTVLMLGFTSGTTGERKPAMLTHMNFISGQTSQEWLGFSFTSNDTYLSYVPLTHVYEQIMHISALMFGFRIGYSSNNISNLIYDVRVLQPTIFASFPAFYNKIYKKIRGSMDDKKGGWLANSML